MPCGHFDDHTYRNDGDQELLDTLTQDLCYLCANLMEQGLLNSVASPRILKWWKKHKIEDRDRIIDSIEDLMKNYYDDHGEFLSPDEVAEILIKSAKDEHPLSDYHKQWFKNMAELYVPKYLRRVKDARQKEITKIQRKIDKIERK